MPDIAPTAKIYPNVRLGADVRVGPWAIVGLPPDGAAPGELETIVADGAVIRSHTVIYAGSKIGPGFQTGHHALVGPGMEIGARCSVGTNSMTAGYAELRDGARIHGLGFVGEFASIQEGAWVGPYALVESDRERVTVVAAGAILALHVHILPGVRVGERSLLGTRCLISKDVAPYRLVVGDPPRALRSIEKVTAPTAGADGLYQPDPPEVKEAALARHALRDGCELNADHWRHQMWKHLHRSHAAAAAPPIARVFVGAHPTRQLVDSTL